MKMIYPTKDCKYDVGVFCNNFHEIEAELVRMNEIISDGRSGIVNKSTGETIVATDSSKAELEGLRIFGRSEQGSTTGAQLLDVSALKTINDATMAIADDGYEISVSGGDANRYSYSEAIIDLSAILGKTIYIKVDAISGVLDESVSKKCVQIIVDSSDGKKQYIQIHENKLSAKVLIREDVLCVAIGIYCNNSGSVLSEKETITVKGLIVSLVESKWEPYTGGIASPNPEYPQEIESVGDGGSVEIGVVGKNLIQSDFKSRTVNGMTFTVNEDSSITVNGTATSDTGIVLADSGKTLANLRNGKYILTGCPSGGSDTGYRLQLWNFKMGSGSAKDYGNGVEFDFANEGGTYNIAIIVISGITVNNLTFYPMLRYASVTDDTYEPYQKQSAIFTTPNGLPGIKVTDASLASYTDENGQMWCADEVDLERGVYVQRIAEKNLATLQTWTQNSTWTNLSGFYNTGAMPDALPVSGYSTKANIMCNRLLISTASDIADSRKNAIAQGGGKNVYVSVDGVETEEDLKAYFAENETYIRYILATPIETPLSAEEIAAYKALHTNYPTTTVMSDSGADMEVEYVADTKSYIDRKFEELKVALGV